MLPDCNSEIDVLLAKVLEAKRINDVRSGIGSMDPKSWEYRKLTQDLFDAAERVDGLAETLKNKAQSLYLEQQE